MSCCGKKVNHRPIPGGEFIKAVHKSQKKTRLKAGILFRYTGVTSLTVQGPFSGRHYRFKKPNAVLMTDAKDYHALLTVPGLEVLVQEG
jgi:hypothetical protein